MYKQIKSRYNVPMKFLVLPLFFLIVSCGQSVNPVDSGLENQVFHFGNGTEPQGLDPHIVTGVPENHLLTALCEGLTIYNPKGGSQLPGVAESWDISSAVSYTHLTLPTKA